MLLCQFQTSEQVIPWSWTNHRPLQVAIVSLMITTYMPVLFSDRIVASVAALVNNEFL